jgi:hypothetical protein
MKNLYKALPLTLLLAACNQGPDQATVAKNVENELKQKYTAEIKAEVEAKVMANIQTELNTLKALKQENAKKKTPISELNEEDFYIEALKYKSNSSFISAACSELKNYPNALPVLVKFAEENINESYSSYAIDAIISFSSDPSFKEYITKLSSLEGDLSKNNNFRNNLYKLKVKRVEVDPSSLADFINFLNILADSKDNYINYLDLTYQQALKLNGYANAQDKKAFTLVLIKLFPKINSSYDLRKAYKVLQKLTGETLGDDKYDNKKKTAELYMTWAKKNLQLGE